MDKKFWIAPGHNNDHGIICVRAATSKEVTGVPQLVVNETVLPPLGHKISLDEAREKRLQQDHFTIGTMAVEDLMQLKEAIDKFLRARFGIYE